MEDKQEINELPISEADEAHDRAVLAGPPRHRPAAVVRAVLLLYVLAGLATTKPLSQWAQHLPAGTASEVAKRLTSTLDQVAGVFHAGAPSAALAEWSGRFQDSTKHLESHSYAAGADPAGRASLRSTSSNASFGNQTPSNADTDANAPSTVKGSGPQVLVIGDSIMLTVGPALKRVIEDRLAGAATVRAKLATGLARPDVYDWVSEVYRLSEHQHFSTVVAMLGTNDSQDFYVGSTLIEYGTAEWVKIYNLRLAALMTAVCASADHGLWLGMPPMRNEGFSRKMLRINNWAQERVREHSCMRYVDTGRVLGDGTGGYTSHLTLGSHLEKVRMGDGIHVTRSGGTLMASALLGLLRPDRLNNAPLAH